jgi:hypothetical protein
VGGVERVRRQAPSKPIDWARQRRMGVEPTHDGAGRRATVLKLVSLRTSLVVCVCDPLKVWVVAFAVSVCMRTDCLGWRQRWRQDRR